MIIFKDRIKLDNDVANWYIDQAKENEENVFELFEIVLTEYYLKKELEE